MFFFQKLMLIWKSLISILFTNWCCWSFFFYIKRNMAPKPFVSHTDRVLVLSLSLSSWRWNDSRSRSLIGVNIVCYSLAHLTTASLHVHRATMQFLSWNSHLFLSLVGSLFLSIARCTLSLSLPLSHCPPSLCFSWTYLHVFEIIYFEFTWILVELGHEHHVCEYAWKRKRETFWFFISSSKHHIFSFAMYDSWIAH